MTKSREQKTIRVQITIGVYDYELLKQWAESHDKTPSEYAGQIVVARIEANEDLIKKRSSDYLEWSNKNN